MSVMIRRTKVHKGKKYFVRLNAHASFIPDHHGTIVQAQFRGDEVDRVDCRVGAFNASQPPCAHWPRYCSRSR
jgi:hypothetical protein